MGVSYKRLWKLLIDKDMKKRDLKEAANLSNVIKLRERSQKTHRAGYEQTHTLLFF